MSPDLHFPATCELCGHWIPKHAGDCPRNGVHPSQWSPLQSLDTTKPNTRTNAYDYDVGTCPFSYQPVINEDFCINLYLDIYNTIDDSHAF